jgi:division protein CdvB (Snf7/Vps24/ESCRT-III family)
MAPYQEERKPKEDASETAEDKLGDLVPIL